MANRFVYARSAQLSRGYVLREYLEGLFQLSSRGHYHPINFRLSRSNLSVVRPLVNWSAS